MTNPNMMWRIHAAPATRFYLNSDGHIYMEFQREKMGEIVDWAREQYEIFQQLGRMQVKKDMEQAVTEKPVVEVEVKIK